MNIKDISNKPSGNPLYGFFDLIHIALKNKRIFLFFLIISFLVNIYIFFTNRPLDNNILDIKDHDIKLLVKARPSIENFPIILLSQELKKMNILMNPIKEFDNNLEVFNPTYLFRSFYDLITSDVIIHQVLIKENIIKDNTTLHESNELIEKYAKKIEKTVKGRDLEESISSIEIIFNSDNFENDKSFLMSLILAANNTIRNSYILNMNNILKRFEQHRDDIMKQIQSESYKQAQDIKLLKVHYETAKKLNIIKPQLAKGEAASNITLKSPLFFQLGTDYILAIIESIEDTLLSEIESDRMSMNLIYESVTDLIRVSGINSEDELFIISFNPNSIKRVSSTVGINNETNQLLLYIFVFLTSIVFFIAFILFKESYKNYLIK